VAGETLSWCTAHSRWHSDDRGFFCLTKGEGWAATPLVSRAGHAATAGYDLSQLRAAFVSAEALRASGFGAAELREVGFGAAELREGGFGLSKLKAASFGTAELKAAGFGAPELKSAGFSAAEFVAGGSGAELHALFGFRSIAEAKAGGLTTPAELFAAGYTTLAEYKHLGFTFGQLCSTGRPDGKPFSSGELISTFVPSTARVWQAYVADMRKGNPGWASTPF
jgi:hypothetical protein